MDTSYDEDGDLSVNSDVNCWVLPHHSGIRLLTMFGFDPTVSHAERLECVNKINIDYMIVKAYEGENDTLRFAYDILVTGGITPKAFVLALQRFCSIPRSAVKEHADQIVV
jgi:Putative bacterial sensory transduction regulator